MKLYILAISLVIQTYHEMTQATQEYGVLRMDDNVYYLRYQDIVKAFNESKPAWYYGYNYDEDARIDAHKDVFGSTDDTCVYFKKDALNDTNVNFTRHYRKNGEDKYEHLFGKFFNTTIKDLQSQTVPRNTCNAIIVTKAPGEKGHTGFKLLYTDYKDCTILRPLPLSSDGLPVGTDDQSYQNIKEACIVLLSDPAARGIPPGHQRELPDWLKSALQNEVIKSLPEEMPPFCKFVYRNLCGEKPVLKKVFNDSCPRIPNALGC